MNIQFAIAILAGLAATVEDIARRRISNWIPVATLIGGVLCQGFERGWRGVLSALGGAMGGFLVFLVFYWLGGMGGGDVKLMAGLGAVVGIERVLPAALWTAACGGVFAALCVAAVALNNIRVRKPASGGRLEHIPYAPAIALGSWLALLAKS
jgi:prepilin peptidase CpaA